MKQKLKWLALSILPLILGCIYSMCIESMTVSMYWVINIVFFALWMLLSYLLADKTTPPKVQASWMCRITFVALVLILYQELLQGHYWSGYLGVATQYYFLPGLTLSAGAVGALLPIGAMWLACIAEAAAMFFLSLLAARLKVKRSV